MAVTAESVVVELLARTDRFDQQIKNSATGFVDATGRIERSADRLIRQTGAVRAAQVNLGQQVQDITIGLSTGQSPFTVLAQQAGQTASAVSGLGGVIGRVGQTIAGPFGSIVVAATAVLGNLALAHFNARDAAEAQNTSEEKLAKTLSSREKVAQRNPIAAERLRQDRLLEQLPAGSVVRAQLQADFDRRNGIGTANLVRDEPVIEVTASRTINRGGPSGNSGNTRASIGRARAAAPLTGLAALAAESPLDAARRVADTLPVQTAKEFLASAELQLPAVVLDFKELEETVKGISTIKVIDGDDIRFAQEFTSTLNQGLANAIVSGQSFGSVIEQIGRQVLSSGILSLLSGGAQGTSFGSFFSGIGSLFGFAGGGPVNAGQVIKINETGQELFRPSVPGRIIPAGQAAMMGGGGGASIVQNLSINFAGNAATREEAATFARIAYEQSLRAFREAGAFGVPSV